jgi:hypothetical protein
MITKTTNFSMTRRKRKTPKSQAQKARTKKLSRKRGEKTCKIERARQNKKQTIRKEE